MKQHFQMAKLLALCVALTCLLGALVGCTSTTNEADKTSTTQKPVLSSPDIIQDNTLVVGVNLGFAPYAGNAGSSFEGIDIDVASYIASKLGLTPKFIAVDPDSQAEALAQGTVDIVMSAPMNDENMAVVSPYSEGGVAYYCAQSEADTATVATNYPIGVQKESVGYWKLLATIGESNMKVYDTDAEIIADLEKGTLSGAVMDRVVGDYAIAGGSPLQRLDYLDSPLTLGVGVSQDKTTLSQAIEKIASTQEAQSVFESLNRKWLEKLPTTSDE